MAHAAHPWLEVVTADPTNWLLASEESPARWLALTGFDDSASIAEDARRASVGGPVVQRLVGRLPGWGGDEKVSGHNSPAYLPNLIHLLADLGARQDDEPRIEDALDQLSSHQRPDGAFQAFGRAPRHPTPVWGSLPCDTHIITEALVRFGRMDTQPARLGLLRIATDLTATDRGPGWGCIPDPEVGFRGPGRRSDLCPQVTLEALRLFARIPAARRPDGLEDAARSVLDVWEQRGTVRPYMFGHGVRFKTVKWPPFWYGAYWMLDALGRYPGLWIDGRPEDRRRLAELTRCLIDYNVGADGKVVPKSIYRGFEDFSFGQKRHPSPIATAMLAGVVARLSDLADDIQQVDSSSLPSSKGGTRSARPPRR